jgi:enamine deaminase RidA (YjgF/YER057c/UK114 family)
MSVEFLGGTRTGAGGQPLPFSPAVKAGPFVFVSGQIAMGENGEIVPGGIEAQTRQTLKNVEKALALAGCTVKDVVKSTVWLHDARDFWTFNRVYADEAWRRNPKPGWRSWISGGMVVRIETNGTLRIFHGYPGRSGCVQTADRNEEKLRADFRAKSKTMDTPAKLELLSAYFKAELPDKNNDNFLTEIYKVLFVYDPGLGVNEP